MKTCFFIGHGRISEDLSGKLDAEIERHIVAYGVEEFTVGHYGDFDWAAVHALRQAKERHRGVTLHLLEPYALDHPVKLPQGFDGLFYPPGLETVPKSVAIVRANQYMVRNSDFLIAYNRGFPGNTRNLCRLAARLEAQGKIQITNLAL